MIPRKKEKKIKVQKKNFSEQKKGKEGGRAHFRQEYSFLKRRVGT